jgi:integrase
MSPRPDNRPSTQRQPKRDVSTAARKRGRPKTGSVETWTRKNGDVGFAVRFLDQNGVGRYERCGLASEGWSHRRAEIELENFESEVAAGVYAPTPDAIPVEERDPLFGPFASSFLAEHAVEITPNTRAFYAGLLDHQLLPFFQHARLSQITWSSIDTYKKQRLMLMQRIRAARTQGKVLRAGDHRPLRLSERTINHSINLLSQILDEAVRRPDLYLSANVARDKKLRVKVPKKTVRDWLEPDEVITLLEAAEQVDNPVKPETERKAREVRRLRDEEHLTIKQITEQLEMSQGGICWLYTRRRPRIVSGRRAIIATLSSSGTRNTELCLLRWRDLDFHGYKIRIPASKTNRGVREIDMTPWLREQLLTYRASLGEVSVEDPVFPTRDESFRDKDNLNRRVIAPVQRAAAELRSERGLAPLPTGLSAHVFRRTYTTLMAEAGAPITYVQDQVGHESARLTLEIYARVSRSRDRQKWGRAFDELMAGAVPATAYEPANPVVLPVIDPDAPGADYDSAAATGEEA